MRGILNKMKTIALSKGLKTLVDDEDFDFLNQWKWCADSKGYAMRTTRRSETGTIERKAILMHRVILNATKEQWVDHIDGATLDNRKSNLRFATRTENQRNRNKPKSNTSGFKGVWFDKKRVKYVASIKTNGKTRTKRFESKVEAAIHYNEMAIKLFGKFARLNDV